MHFSNSMVAVAALTTAALAHPPVDKRQTIPPTNDGPPDIFDCDNEGFANCARIGNGLDMFPDSGDLVLGPRENRELNCQRGTSAGRDTGLTITSDADNEITVSWDQVRRRFSDIGAICSGPANSDTQTTADCNGRATYPDGTTVIAGNTCA